jgi:hypothetical protein
MEFRTGERGGECGDGGPRNGSPPSSSKENNTMSNDKIPAKPATYQGDLAKLPRALAPLIARPQWAIWRWTLKPGGGWQKPPFQAVHPEQHASVTDPRTWSDYATALAAVQAGNGEGISYIQTKTESLASIDLDHCRDVNTCSVEIWAQRLLEQALHTYCEVTPSGTGLRIWGMTAGKSLHRKFELDTNKDAALELFATTNKALTISGFDLKQGRTIGNIDRLLDYCVFYGEKHKPVAKESSAFAPVQFNGNGCGYSIEEIEQLVREGAPVNGGNRSNLFHTIVGHYIGCDWPIEQTFLHLHQFPDGIGNKYIAEGRLSVEVSRSFRRLEGDAPAIIG